MLGSYRALVDPLVQDAAPHSVRACGGNFLATFIPLLAGFGLAVVLGGAWQHSRTQEPSIDMAGRFLPRSTRPIAPLMPIASSRLRQQAKLQATTLREDAWQARLDAALLGVDLNPQERLSLLQQALRDPEISQDLRSAVAIIQEKGIGEGHPEFIDKLWPQGTTARSDLEGLTALRKQVPEVLQDVQKQVQQREPGSFFRPASDSTATNVQLPNASAVFDSLATLATNPEKQQELVEEAKDLLRNTPKGLETPEYTVERTIDGPTFLGKPELIELRAYEEFTVARTSMKGAGFTTGSGASGFNTLAAYLFGGNEEKQDMAMTMPVEMTVSTGENQGTMAFVLPKQNAGEPPAPLPSSDITIDKVPARLVAAKTFPGIVTDEEVERQKAALLEALAADGSVTPVDESQVIVLQYNSPLTVPWRRRNEVTIVVTEKKAETAKPEIETAKPEISYVYSAEDLAKDAPASTDSAENA